MKTAILDLQTRNKDRLLYFDRYVLTAAPRSIRYFFNHLLAPHNCREKALSCLFRYLPGNLGRGLLTLLSKPRKHSPASATATVGFSGRPLNTDGTQDFIETCDYHASTRGQSLQLLFDDTTPYPLQLVKYRNNAEGRLGNEAAWLAKIRQQATPALQSTLPEVLGYREQEEQEWLCQTTLPGRSGYVELRQSWHPGTLIHKHLHGAADWLALFQESTGNNGPAVNPAHALDELTETARRAGINDDLWRQLQHLVNSQRIPVCIAHGDFWIRNTLFSNEQLTGVVDWEHAHYAGHPFDDLFFFLLSYAEVFSSSGHNPAGSGRLECLEASFLKPTPISITAREVVKKFSQRRHLASEYLQPMFAWYLLRQARAAAADEQESAQWLACCRQLEDVPCYAFSG